MTSPIAATESCDDAYFDEALHRDREFRNNAAKREQRRQSLLRMVDPGPWDRVAEVGCVAAVRTLAWPLFRTCIVAERGPA